MSADFGRCGVGGPFLVASPAPGCGSVCSGKSMPENNNPGEFALGFGVSAEYAPHLAAALRSIMAHASDRSLSIFVVHAGLASDLKAKIEACAQEATFDWIEVKPESVPDSSTQVHFNKSIFFRLFLPDRIPARFSRLVYLDSDIVVLEDVHQLAKTDLAGLPIGAVASIPNGPRILPKWREIGFDPHNYFNSGVFVLDLEIERRERNFDRVLEISESQSQNLPFGDQDALNVVYQKRWKPMSPLWNIQRRIAGPIGALEQFVMSKGKLHHGFYRPFLIHFTESRKPWQQGELHYAGWLYLKYLKETPFYGEIIRSGRIYPMIRLIR